MVTNVEQVYEIYENIKPLNFGRRLLFSKFCLRLVRDGLIEEDDVEEFLTEEFLFEDDEEETDEGKDHKKNIKLFLNTVFNLGYLYVGYRILRGIF